MQRLAGRDLPGRGSAHARARVAELPELAVASGVRRLVLLSGRGEEETQAAGVDLAAWIFNPSDSEYQAAARGHDVQ